MKKIIVLLSVLLTLLTFSSCTNEEPSPSNTQQGTETDANYYVKYTALAYGGVGYENARIESVTVETETGSKTIEPNVKSWEETYGPVSKGFKAKIQATGASKTVRIYVCRGEEPFVIKAEGSSSASYTIDF
ncbi:hypothetical protein QUW50_11070 [Barnesiella viscericola]|uniref:hypothetical protein n=1 Tax=Barnesiella viscericola TaxID=397865 RepID=UPI0025A40C5D|nr:hypothetical protein [Barnesiella viscericola]MDM8269570.1 hypothetical protein [Barnesiella viscericola]